MPLLPLTVEDTQMILMLKPYLSLRGQSLVDGLLTLALVSNRALRNELSPVPVLQLFSLVNTKSRIRAERAHAQALGLVKEGQYMPQLLDSKDVSLILAIKPFLSEQSQTLIDTLVNLLSVISGPPERKVDPEAVANLINLIAQANTPKPKDSASEFESPPISPPPEVSDSTFADQPYPSADLSVSE